MSKHPSYLPASARVQGAVLRLGAERARGGSWGVRSAMHRYSPRATRRLIERIFAGVGGLALLVATTFVCPGMSMHTTSMGAMAQTGMTQMEMVHQTAASPHAGRAVHTARTSSPTCAHQHPASPLTPVHPPHNMPPCAHCAGHLVACLTVGRVTFVSATTMTIAVVPPVVVRTVVVPDPESTRVTVAASTPPPAPDILTQKQSLLI